MRIIVSHTQLISFRLFSFLTIMVLSGCRTIGTDTTNQSQFITPEQLPELVQISLYHLPFIIDDELKFSIINSNIHALIIQDQIDSAIRLIDNTVDFVDSHFTGAGKIEALISLARGYIDLGEVSGSRSLIEESLRLLYELGDMQQSETLIQQIISVCFILNDDGIDLLQEVIRKIYIIKDYELRTRLLLNTARQYQEESEGKKADVLLQQAIPAAESIPDPLQRAHAYSLLSLRFMSEGDERARLHFFGKTIAVLEELQGSENNALFADIAVNLAQAGFTGQALTLSTSMSISHHFDELLELAVIFHRQNQLSVADQLLTRITEIPDTSSAAPTVSMLLKISRAHSDRGEQQAALSNSAETALLHARLGNVELALNLLVQMTNPYIKAMSIALLYEQSNRNDITSEFIAPYMDGLSP